MKRKQIKFLSYFLVIGLIASLAVGMASCGSNKTTTPTLSSIALTPNPSGNLTVSYSQTFQSTGTYSDGSTTDITTLVTWDSSDPAVATINSNGSATGVEVGTANITASLDGITSPAITLNVISLSSIVVTPNPPDDLAVGSTEQFTAVGYEWTGSKDDINSQVTWASDNTGVATISSTGLATGVSAGTANITASLEGVTNPAISLTVVVPTSTTSTTPTTTP